MKKSVLALVALAALLLVGLASGAGDTISLSWPAPPCGTTQSFAQVDANGQAVPGTTQTAAGPECPPPPPTSASDDFNRADESPLAGNWTNYAGTLKLAGNAASPTSGTSDAEAYWNADTFADDQFSQAAISVTGANGGSQGMGVVVRSDHQASRDEYRLVADHAASGNIELSKFSGGSYSMLKRWTQAWTNGAVLRLEAAGNVLTVKLDGAVVGSYTDSSPIASGSVGLAFSSNESAASADNWSGGNLDSGAPPPPPPPPPPSSCTTSISSGLAAAIQAASGGDVICLSSGSYGNLSLTDVSKSADVTVQPAPGADVTIGEFNFQNVSHLHFTGQGGSMNLGGSTESYLDADSGCSTYVTFDYLRFTNQIEIHPRCSMDQHWLIDHDNLNNLGQFEARITVIGPWPNDPTVDQGLTISNSTFNGGCSKGIQFLGDSMGARVVNNEFANLSQSGCDPIHIGGIQLYGTEDVLLKGNYFHDNGDAAGGLSIVYDGTYNSVIEDNVWVCTCIYPWSIQASSMQNTVIRHNTFAGGGGIHFQHDGTAPYAAGNHIYDNVFMDPSNGITDSSGANWGTEDHNLDSGLSGTGDITGDAIFTGAPGYDGWHLAAGSPGKGAASDGLDLGIR